MEAAARKAAGATFTSKSVQITGYIQITERPRPNWRWAAPCAHIVHTVMTMKLGAGRRLYPHAIGDYIDFDARARSFSDAHSFGCLRLRSRLFLHPAAAME